MDNLGQVDSTGKTDNFETSLKKGVIEMLILRVLGSGEHYSREITQQLAKGGIIISDGTFYPLINRMRKDGLVNYKIVEDSSGVIKKYYSISPQGQQQLAQMQQLWQKFSQSINLIIND